MTHGPRHYWPQALDGRTPLLEQTLARARKRERERAAVHLSPCPAPMLSRTSIARLTLSAGKEISTFMLPAAPQPAMLSAASQLAMLTAAPQPVRLRCARCLPPCPSLAFCLLPSCPWS